MAVVVQANVLLMRQAPGRFRRAAERPGRAALCGFYIYRVDLASSSLAELAVTKEAALNKHGCRSPTAHSEG